jgi:hypothetical protein
MKKFWPAAVSIAAPIALFFMGGISMAFAQANTGQPISLTNPLGSNCTDLTCPMQAVINFLFTIAIPLCGIMVLVGGFQMLTAAGDPAKFSNGRKTILYAVAGFAIVLVAGGVATLIKNTLGGS